MDSNKIVKLATIIIGWFVLSLVHAQTTLSIIPNEKHCVGHLNACVIQMIAGSNTPATLTIFNNSTRVTATATNVRAVLPASWSDVTQNASACVSLPPKTSCTLSFLPGNTAHTLTSIPIVGNNARTSYVSMEVTAPTYTLGGNVTGLTGTVILLNNGTNTTPIGTDGPFTFSTPVAQGSPYLVTVGTQPVGQTCSVANGTGIMGGANVTNVIVTCSMNAFTVGGTVAGLTGTVTLLNNGTDATPVSADGPFTFPTPIAQGSPYLVTVGTQPLGQMCSVANGSGTMGGANVTNVTVTCSTSTYTVGGSVSGLAGGTVTLLNNGADATPVSADGSFTFLIPVADGSPYLVTVGTQPSLQTCSITNDSGTISGANVTNVAVSCLANTTTLTVDPTGTIPVYSVPGAPSSLTVNNTGTNTAYNVYAMLPGGWIGVSQDVTTGGCTSIIAGGSCTLQFTSTTPYVAQANIVITGDNIDNPPTTALAFTISNYLVWSVSGLTAEVIDTADLPSDVWTQSSDTPSITGAQDPSNGVNNTLTIVTYINPSTTFPLVTPYAASDCYTSLNGGASAGEWYLPAICQMSSFTGFSGFCSNPSVPNISQNLVVLGFGGISAFTDYWSSTENPTTPNNQAKTYDFSFSAISNSPKNFARTIRCARTMTY